MRCANEDCGGWVKPGEEIITDAGVFHDTERCLPEDVYEGIVWLYSDHLEEEHREDQEVRAAGGSDAGSSITQQSPVEASPALTPWSTEELLARERRFMDARLP